jgi:hypothetical protein
MPNRNIFKNRVVSKRDATRESSNFIEIFKDANSKKIRYLNTLNQSKALIGSTFGHTYFVSPDGDDSLGEVGNIIDTFKTITAARDQAINDGFADSVVYVFPGTYAETEIQYGTHEKPGVMYLSAGVLIQPNLQINSAGIIGVDQTEKLFQVNDTVALGLPPGSLFRISGSTGNDGIYTVVSVSEDTDVGTTDIIVVESIPDGTVDGAIDTTREIIVVGYATEFPSPLATNFSVYGYGILDQRETIDATPDWPGFAIVLSIDPTAIFKGEFDTVKVEQGVPVYAASGIMTITAQLVHMYGSSGYGATFRGDADVTLNVRRVINEVGWCLYVRSVIDAGGNYFSGRVIVNADVLESKVGWQTIAAMRVGLGGVVIINCPEIISADSYALAFLRIGLDGPTSEARVEINGNSFVTGIGMGVYNSLSGGGKIQVNGNIRTQSNRIFDDVIGGNTTDNELYINGDMEIVTGSSDAIEAQTGTLRLNGSLKNNGAGNDGINITGAGDLVIDTLKIICDGESVTAAVARNAIVNFQMSSNKAANANVSFIGPGNIGVDVNCK